MHICIAPSFSVALTSLTPQVIVRTLPAPLSYCRLRCPAAPGFHALPGQSVDVDEHGRIADWGAWKGDARSRGGRGYAVGTAG